MFSYGPNGHFNPYLTRGNNYLFTVELRCPNPNFPPLKSDVASVISSLLPKTEHHDVFPSRHVAARLRFPFWDDAAASVEALWESRLRGSHRLDPFLVPNDYCLMDELQGRLFFVFTDFVRSLFEGPLVRKIRALSGDDMEKVSRGLSGKEIKLSEFNRLLEKKEGLEAKKGMIEKRIGEFQRALGCILRHLEDEGEYEVAEDYIVLKLEKGFDWVRLDYLIKRECRRLEDMLPIYAFRWEILKEVSNQQVVVLVGETGSGKSTQLVQYLADSGVADNGSIICTQPRKLAAISLAHRVQEESSRCYPDDRAVTSCPTSASFQMYNSNVVFMTDHCLLQHYMKNKNLYGISCIIVDEAHERSLNTDILLALLKNLLSQRPDLRLIIMSATADAKQLGKYFFCCDTFNVEGRNFPVEVCYEPYASKSTFDSGTIGSYASDVLRKVTEIHKMEKEGTGTILAFLTSQAEVEWACEKFQSFGAVALPLHGKLSHSDQLRVFDNYPGKRKVIFSTNVAETSLTIPGVKYVVDSGMMKESRFEPGTGMNVLKVCRISQGSAKQRAGRAGRTGPGKCYRLYSYHDFESMISHQEPEIRRVHLGVAVLRILALGIKDVQSFDFIDAPSTTAIDLAIRNLIQLGAVSLKDDKLELSKDGIDLVKLGIEPRLGKLILHCFKLNVGKEGLILAAVMANSSSIFCRVGNEEDKSKSDCLKVQFCHRDGDLFTLLSVYKEWESIPKEKSNKWCWDNSINSKTMKRCQDTVSEWDTCLKNELKIIIPSYWRWDTRVSTVHDTNLKNAILSALPENVALYSGYDHLGYEVALTGKHVQLHPSSSLLNFSERPSWVVFGDILSASNQYLVCVTAFDYEYLRTLSPSPLFDTSKMENRRLQLKVLSGFGSTLLKRFCGRAHSNVIHLVSRLRTTCLDERIGIEVNVDQNKVLLYASSQNMEYVSSLVNSVLDYEKKWLQNECLEKRLYQGGPGLSPSFALFGAGAEIKHLELEKRCLTVDVFHSKVSSVDEKELLPFLEEYALGSICIVQKFTGYGNGEDEKWGRVTFLKPGAAQKAAELNPVEFSGGQLKIIPSRSTPGGDHQMSTYVTAKVSWPRRMSRGFGFAKCADQDAAFIMEDLSNLNIGDKYVRTDLSLKEKGSVMVSGFDRMLSESEVLEALRASTNREIWEFFLVRSDAVVNNLSSDACEEALLREISPLIPKSSPHGSSVSVQVLLPNPKDAFTKAKIMFDSKVHFEVATALQEIGGKVLPGCFPWQKIRSQQLFHSSLVCSTAVYFVIRDQLELLLGRFRNRRGAKCYLEMKKSICIVRISANATRTVAELRRPLEQLMLGTAINDSSLTPSVIQILFSRDGIYLMRTIQRETGTYISFERHSLIVRIFGPLYKIEAAKKKLIHSLVNLYESKALEIQLRGSDMPPDLMKKVVYKFGPDLQGLKEKFPGSSFSLSTRRHVISIMSGNKELKQKVEDLVREIAQTAGPCTNEPENEAACPICLCEVEEGYRLEDCGHNFCRLCLVEQCDSAMKSRDSFPLRCMHEGCGVPILLTDLRTLLGRDKLEEIFRSSLSSFVAASEGKFRFCPSPDCPSVYQAASIDTPGKTFVCGACSVETCTSCHLENHPFISCQKYKEFKEDPDLSLKEWCKGKEDVKECPVCGHTIEKIDGCNHIECRCKKHICWVCLEFFENSDDCYGHLRFVHQAII